MPVAYPLPSRLTIAACLALLLVSSGCKSLSWKPSSLFSWNRAPEESMYAGPAITEVPTSPATQHTPNAIAATGTTNAGIAAQSGSAYGYSPQTSSSPQAGLAAQANGYQTGPYQMTSATRQPTTTAVASPQNPGSAGGLPNPYGGTYTGSVGTPSVGTATLPNIQLPNSVNQAIEAQRSAPANYPSIPLPGSSMPQVTSPAATTGTLPNVSMPSIPTYPSASVGQTGTAGGTGTVPTSSAYQGVAGGQGGVSATLNLPTGTPAQPASFTPGTTGRTTQYNFGN